MFIPFPNPSSPFQLTGPTHLVLVLLVLALLVASADVLVRRHVQVVLEMVQRVLGHVGHTHIDMLGNGAGLCWGRQGGSRDLEFG